VFAYNSKVYYVITQGAGTGDAVTRFPITGNETVLDAISNINGLTAVSSKKIWIARPVPHTEEMHVLPVDWQGITANGTSLTNYQILPGDRVFVAEDKLVAFDTRLAKLLAPFQRIQGFTLLTTGTAGRLSGNVLQNASGQGGGGGGFGGGGFF
jgi:polysaccharide export outer membrane protein